MTIPDIFVTGSHVYGRPQPDSDVDVVAFVDNELAAFLADRLSDHLQSPPVEGYGGCTFKLGPLNLICVTNQIELAAWWEARKRCCAEASTNADEVFTISRERACQIHAEVRDELKSEDVPAPPTFLG